MGDAVGPVKEGDFVRVVGTHSEGVDRHFGKVESIYFYGRHARYVIRLEDGRSLNLDPSVVRSIDIVTMLATQDEEFRRKFDRPDRQWPRP